MKSNVFTVALFGAIAALTPVANGLEPQASSSAPALVKVVNDVKPHYPERLLRQGVTHGEAVVAISVEPDGHVSDSLVVRYTHRLFADVALDAVRQWRFKIAEPVGVIMQITFQFQQSGVVAIERFGLDIYEEPQLPTSGAGYAYQPCAAADLDRPIKPIHVVSPSYSNDLEQKGIAGTVEVNFYVDEQGHPRLAAPVSAENPILGALATGAIEQWQFEPPTRAGKPVLVHVNQRFAFGTAK